MKKSTVTILVLLAVALAAAGLACWYYTQTPGQNTNQGEEIDTSDWDTYVDDVYELTFQYPKNWVIEKDFGEPDPNLNRMLIIHGSDALVKNITIRIYQPTNLYGIGSDERCNASWGYEDYTINFSCWNLDSHPEILNIYNRILDSASFRGQRKP